MLFSPSLSFSLCVCCMVFDLSPKTNDQIRCVDQIKRMIDPSCCFFARIYDEKFLVCLQFFISFLLLFLFIIAPVAQLQVAGKLEKFLSITHLCVVLVLCSLLTTSINKHMDVASGIYVYYKVCKGCFAFSKQLFIIEKNLD